MRSKRNVTVSNEIIQTCFDREHQICFSIEALNDEERKKQEEKEALEEKKREETERKYFTF